MLRLGKDSVLRLMISRTDDTDSVSVAMHMKLSIWLSLSMNMKDEGD
jgi:hypothetical protein